MSTNRKKFYFHSYDYILRNVTFLCEFDKIEIPLRPIDMSFLGIKGELIYFPMIPPEAGKPKLFCKSMDEFMKHFGVNRSLAVADPDQILCIVPGEFQKPLMVDCRHESDHCPLSKIGISQYSETYRRRRFHVYDDNQSKENRRIIEGWIRLA